MVIVFGIFQGRPFCIQDEDGWPLPFVSFDHARERLRDHMLINAAETVILFNLQTHEMEEF